MACARCRRGCHEHAIRIRKLEQRCRARQRTRVRGQRSRMGGGIPPARVATEAGCTTRNYSPAPAATETGCPTRHHSPAPVSAAAFPRLAADAVAPPAAPDLLSGDFAAMGRLAPRRPTARARCWPARRRSASRRTGVCRTAARRTGFCRAAWRGAAARRASWRRTSGCRNARHGAASCRAAGCAAAGRHAAGRAIRHKRRAAVGGILYRAGSLRIPKRAWRNVRRRAPRMARPCGCPSCRRGESAPASHKRRVS